MLLRKIVKTKKICNSLPQHNVCHTHCIALLPCDAVSCVPCLMCVLGNAVPVAITAQFAPSNPHQPSGVSL